MLTIETVWQTPVMLLIKAIHLMRPENEPEMKKKDTDAEKTFLANIEDAISNNDVSDLDNIVRRFYGVIQGMKGYVAQNLLDITSSDRFYYVWVCLTYFANNIQLQEIHALWAMSAKPLIHVVL